MNQDGVRQLQSFLVKYVAVLHDHTLMPLVPVLVAISRPDKMQLHELILTKILIC